MCILTTTEYGRSIHATGVIKSNELIVSVPSAKLINQKVFPDSSIEGTEVTAQAVLAKLLAVAANDPDHPHHLFTKILPPSFDSTPLSWLMSETPTPQQVSDIKLLLQVPAAAAHVQKQKAQVLADYAALQPEVPLAQYVWA